MARLSHIAGWYVWVRYVASAYIRIYLALVVAADIRWWGQFLVYYVSDTHYEDHAGELLSTQSPAHFIHVGRSCLCTTAHVAHRPSTSTVSGDA